MKAENYKTISDLMRQRTELIDQLKKVETVWKEHTEDSTRDALIEINGIMDHIDVEKEEDHNLIRDFIHLYMTSLTFRIGEIDKELNTL